MRVNKRKIASLLLAGALVCSGTTPALAAPKSSASPSPTATVSTKPKSTQKPLDTTVDPNGIYHATLGFETESTYRSVYRYGHFDGHPQGCLRAFGQAAEERLRKRREQLQHGS